MKKTSKTSEKKKKLDSWKEIAAYLDRDVRTVQRWERKKGLPVHRLDDSKRSRVFSYSDEIDNWEGEMLSSKKRKESDLIFSSSRMIRPPHILIFLILITFLLLLFISLSINKKSTSCIAMDFKISGSQILIYDENQSVMSFIETGIQNLENDGHYRTRFQEKFNEGGGYYLPCIIIEDIDHNGCTEILYTFQTKDNSKENILFCHNVKTGNELWKFVAGGKKAFGNKSYSDDYRILGFNVVDIDENGTNEIIVLANHKEDFPGQVIVLDSKGNKIGEYWNSGHINDYGFVDLDYDGSKEILLAGVNEEWKKPCLAILDFFCIDGHSPQSNDFFTCRESKKCNEKYYILMPRDVVGVISGDHYSIRKIILSDDPDEKITLENMVFYTFNFNLELKKIIFSNQLGLEYEKCKRDGIVTKTPSQLRDDLIKEGALYFYKDGTWSDKATKTKFWE
jgi:hypothetical protein